MILAQWLGYKHFLTHLQFLYEQDFGQFDLPQKTFDVEDSAYRFELDQKSDLEVLHVFDVFLRFIFYSFLRQHWFINRLIIDQSILEDVIYLVFVIYAFQFGSFGDSLFFLIRR